MNDFGNTLNDIESGSGALNHEPLLETTATPSPRRASAGFGERLYRARVMISNATSGEEIGALLAAAGYDAAMLEEGQRLYDTTIALHQDVRATYGQRDAVSQRFRTLWQAARFAYNRDLRMARRVLREDANAAKTLLLKGRRKPGFAGWLDQARQFYTKVLASPTYLVRLQTVGITPQVLTAHQQLMLDAVDAKSARAEALASSQRLQRARNQKLAALELWLAGLRAAAEVALVNWPELLHKLTLPAVGSNDLGNDSVGHALGCLNDENGASP